MTNENFNSDYIEKIVEKDKEKTTFSPAEFDKLLNDFTLSKIAEGLTDKKTVKSLLELKGNNNQDMKSIVSLETLKYIKNAITAGKSIDSQMFDMKYSKLTDIQKNIVDACLLGYVISKGNVPSNLASNKMKYAKKYYKSLSSNNTANNAVNSIISDIPNNIDKIDYNLPDDVNYYEIKENNNKIATFIELPTDIKVDFFAINKSDASKLNFDNLKSTTEAKNDKEVVMQIAGGYTANTKLTKNKYPEPIGETYLNGTNLGNSKDPAKSGSFLKINTNGSLEPMKKADALKDKKNLSGFPTQRIIRNGTAANFSTNNSMGYRFLVKVKNTTTGQKKRSMIDFDISKKAEEFAVLMSKPNFIPGFEVIDAVGVDSGGSRETVALYQENNSKLTSLENGNNDKFSNMLVFYKDKNNKEPEIVPKNNEYTPYSRDTTINYENTKLKLNNSAEILKSEEYKYETGKYLHKDIINTTKIVETVKAKLPNIKPGTIFFFGAEVDKQASNSYTFFQRAEEEQRKKVYDKIALLPVGSVFGDSLAKLLGKNLANESTQLGKIKKFFADKRESNLGTKIDANQHLVMARFYTGIYATLLAFETKQSELETKHTNGDITEDKYLEEMGKLYDHKATFDYTNSNAGGEKSLNNRTTHVSAVHAGDVEEDDTEKDDVEEDDTEKDDTEKDDTEKDDTEKDDTEKDDTEKDDTEKDDTEKDENSPEILSQTNLFIPERVRVAFSKNFKLNNVELKPTDIGKVIQDENDKSKFTVEIDGKKLVIKTKKIDEDWNFKRKTDGNLKKDEDKKEYYKDLKIETKKITEKFKKYDVVVMLKNLIIKLNEEETKAGFKKYYKLEDNENYSFDYTQLKISTEETPRGTDLKEAKVDIKYLIPENIKKYIKKYNNENPTKGLTIPTDKKDVIKEVTFDTEGQLVSTSNVFYLKKEGETKLILQSKERNNVTGNYKKEVKKLNYFVDLDGTDSKKVKITTDEREGLDLKDKKVARVYENAESMKKHFADYTTGLGENFSERYIESLSGNKYVLHAIPFFPNTEEYVDIPFSAEYKKDQKRYFKFGKIKDVKIPAENIDKNEENYFVINNLYYNIDLPKGEQTSINPGFTLDYTKTEEIATAKTKLDSENKIIEEKDKKQDQTTGGLQKVSLGNFDKLKLNSDRYEKFMINETAQTIRYDRELFLEEILGFETGNDHTSLGFITFDGNGEPIETTSMNITVNKKNQTIEINDVFGRGRSLWIPFEIQDSKFILGQNSNPDAAYIVAEFKKQKKIFKDIIYENKASITNKINEKLTGSMPAQEFPGLEKKLWHEDEFRKKNKASINAFKNLHGPSLGGLYYLELKNENSKRGQDFLYFKVSKDNKVSLVDADGKPAPYVYIQSKLYDKPRKGVYKVDSSFLFRSLDFKKISKKGEPILKSAPASIKNALAYDIETGNSQYFNENAGAESYMRYFGDSKLGYIGSIPVKKEKKNPGLFLYDESKLPKVDAKNMAESLFDEDIFNQVDKLGLENDELKKMFIKLYINHPDIADALEGKNIKTKNSAGKREYSRLTSRRGLKKIKFKKNKESAEIQLEIFEHMKKDLLILSSIEKIQLKHKRKGRFQKQKNRDKAGSRAIKDFSEKEIENFITTKKTALEVTLLPNKEKLSLNFRPSKYKRLTSSELNTNNGFENRLFKENLGSGTAKKNMTVDGEKYTLSLANDKKNKVYQIVFAAEVQKK